MTNLILLRSIQTNDVPNYLAANASLRVRRSLWKSRNMKVRGKTMKKVFQIDNLLHFPGIFGVIPPEMP
jgi:hypothetical protein